MAITDRYSQLTDEELMAERLDEIRRATDKMTILHALCTTVVNGGGQAQRDHWIEQARKAGATATEIDYYSGRRLSIHREDPGG